MGLHRKVCDPMKEFCVITVNSIAYQLSLLHFEELKGQDLCQCCSLKKYTDLLDRGHVHTNMAGGNGS